jgi:hypothetical protein
MKTDIHFGSQLAHFFLEWEIFQTKFLVKKSKHTFHFQVLFPKKSCRFKITWKNLVNTDRQQITVWPICIACWITKTTNTHSEYVIIIAFPLQQLLHQRTSMLRYTYRLFGSTTCRYLKTALILYSTTGGRRLQKLWFIIHIFYHFNYYNELHESYSSPNIIRVSKDSKMGAACSMYGGKEKCL